MGLYVNINAVESAQSLVMARAIGIALGDHKSLALAVHDVTGNSRLAQQIEIRAHMQGGMRG